MRVFVLVTADLLFVAACGTNDTPSPYQPSPTKSGTSPRSSSSTGGGGSSSGGNSTSTGSGSSSSSGGSSGSTSSGSGGGTNGGDASGGGNFSPFTWIPNAKGLWIWRFDQLDMTADEAAIEATKLGIGWVLIKSGQDDFWSTRYTSAVVQSFTSRGIHVFAWPYITPSDPTASIAGAVAASKVPGTDGLVLDVEIEFQGTSASEFAPAAEKICDGIRSGAPNVFLGYTSFGWVDYHATFPYAAFDQHCGDGFFPQVYWSDFGTTPSDGYTHAVNAIAAAKLSAPVWMIQSNDSGGGGVPTASELNAFFSLAGPRTSLWALTPTSTTQYGDLGGLNWSNKPLAAPNVLLAARAVAPALCETAVAPIDQSTPESTLAGQVALLQNHIIDEAVVAAFAKTVALGVTVDAAALNACATRVRGNAISPDWEMAKRSPERTLVSVFGKSLTGFSAPYPGHYVAEALWCR